MAKTRKIAPKTPATTPSETDPQSWLFLNPAGPCASGIVFGVLRKTYGGRTNSAAEFGWRKAHVGRDRFDPSAWSPNVERVDVVLPADADDALSEPRTLLRRMDDHALAREKALLVYLTLPLGDVERVHAGWERARAFVRERICRDRGLAAMLALHAPGRVGSANPLHCHALIVPRTVGRLGLAHGIYDEELTRDAGQGIVEAMWTQHCGAFR